MIRQLMEVTDNSRPLAKFVLALLFVLLIGAVYVLVYFTGGIKYVYSHSMYLVIIVAGMLLGTGGGLAFGLIGGLTLGPIMPIDTLTGEQQETLNWLYRLGFFMLVGGIVGAFSTFTRQQIAETQWQLEHNPVTTLPNRFSLYRDLAELPDDGVPRRLYLLQITNLPELELRLGIAVRDSMIRTLVKRLDQQIRHPLRQYHVRSNHIAPLVAVSGAEAFEDFLAQANAATDQPVIHQGIPLMPVCVWGSTDIDGQVNTVEEYLRKTEVCVIQARSRGLSQLQYSTGLEETSRRNVEMLGLLKVALDADRLHLNYQPKYALNGRQVTGMEALLRWHDPDRGMISPASFIPLAEDSELIRPLTLWVIRTAFRDLKRLQSADLGMDRVAINISAANLLDPGFIGQLETLMVEKDVHPASFELEVTETSLMRDFSYCSSQIRTLRRMGISVALDDFGTGYSSLQYIDQIPFSTIKIDQLFVRDLLSHGSKQSIVNASIQIAHQLGANTVAEGIEDAETEKMLQSMDCDIGQGYHFARPLSFDRLQEFLSTQPA